MLRPSSLHGAPITPDSRERLLAMFEVAPVGMGIVDLEGHTLMSNEILREMLGYSRDEFARLRFDEYTHPDDVVENLRLFSSMVAGEIDSFEMEKRFFRKDGSILWGHLTSSLMRDADGRPEHAIGMLQDITERKNLEERLGAVQERYRLVVERVPAVVYIAEPGPEGRWHYVSPQSEVMLGITAEEWMADPGLWMRHVHPDDVDKALLPEQLISQKPHGEISSTYYRMVRHDGEIVWVRDDAIMLRDDQGGVLYHGILVDVTREKELEARLEHQAFHDSLTHLPNRKLFRDRVEHCLKRLERDAERRAAVLFVDLDNFKAVNDGLGHAHGDELLVLVAERISNCARGGDTAARIGGDEFALLIEDLSDDLDAVRLAERVLERIRETTFPVAGRAVTVGASIGIAVQSAQDTTDTLLRNADLAMYRAKNSGKGGYAVYESSLHESVSKRLKLETALRTAIEECGDGSEITEDQELSLVFQPITDLATGEVAGVEALARWTHRESGIVPPSDFIPLAEEAGLIFDLGRWVLRRACREFAAWREANGSGAHISVNVSPLQLRDDRLPDCVAEALDDSGLEPSELVLEVTEGVLLLEQCRDVLERLRSFGVKIALDDFGTGYSSMSYLRTFPLDILKIDRAFVNHVGGDAEDRAFAQAIIKLAEVLSLATTAEGIETQEQLDALRAVGCSSGQGYFISRPAALPSIPRRFTIA